MNLWIIFLTGLTTGGLTCLAVQGGLLATAMTRQVVVPADAPPVKQRKYSKKNKQKAVVQDVTGIQIAQNPMPVVYFLIAKLFAYTVLGFILGALGSMFQISAKVQALMQIAAGLFMLVTALNMLNVHPIFRYFVIQPPKFLTRLVRNQAKSQDIFAPALLGLMTVFIPCGTTQVMEAVAMTVGSPVAGALVMFSFILGTSPTFLILGFFATKLRGSFKTAFTYAAVALIVILGSVSIDSGLNVIGSPIVPSRMIASIFSPRGRFTPTGTATKAQVIDGVQELTIGVLSTSYEPGYFTAESGKPLRIRLVTNNTFGCTRAFTIPAYNIQQLLPETGETVIDLPALAKGDVTFTCSMGMYGGVISVS